MPVNAKLAVFPWALLEAWGPQSKKVIGPLNPVPKPPEGKLDGVLIEKRACFKAAFPQQYDKHKRLEWPLCHSAGNQRGLSIAQTNIKNPLQNGTSLVCLSAPLRFVRGKECSKDSVGWRLGPRRNRKG